MVRNSGNEVTPIKDSATGELNNTVEKKACQYGEKSVKEKGGLGRFEKTSFHFKKDRNEGAMGRSKRAKKSLRGLRGKGAGAHQLPTRKFKNEFHKGGEKARNAEYFKEYKEANTYSMIGKGSEERREIIEFVVRGALSIY